MIKNWFTSYKTKNFKKIIAKVYGEYWINEYSHITYCDGSVCDNDHETIVINYLVSFYENEIHDTIIQETGKPVLGTIDYTMLCTIFRQFDMDKNTFIQNGVPGGVVDILLGSNIDPREYAIKELNWKRVKGCEVETNYLTSEDVNIISRGLYKILEDEGSDEGADDEFEEYFNIYVMSAGAYYTGIPLEVIRSGNIREIIEYRQRDAYRTYAKNIFNLHKIRMAKIK